MARKLTKAEFALVNDNIGLVPFVVQMLRKLHKLHAIDPISVGYEGLIDAARCYDNKRGRFSTYACTAIRRRVLAALTAERDKGGTRGRGRHAVNHVEVRILNGHADFVPDKRCEMSQRIELESAKDSRKQLRGAMKGLPAFIRRIVHDQFWNGLSPAQIAQQRRCTTSQVREALQLAISQLRGELPDASGQSRSESQDDTLVRHA